MKGLEACELNRSKLENQFTIGSEYYKQEFVRIVDILNKSTYPIKELKDCTYLITDGDHGATQYKDSGVLYLLSESVKEGYIDLNGGGIRYISNELHNSLKRSVLRTGNVVVTKTGAYYGKSAVIPKNIIEANTSAHVAKIVVKDDVLNPYFLSTFLNSKYGYSQLRRRGIKVSRPEIKLIEFQDIKIPIPSMDFQEKIEQITLECQILLNKLSDEYEKAESDLLKEISFKDYELSNRNINVKNFKKSFFGSGRLDAEYYQPKYEGIEEIIKSYKNGFTYIGKEFEQVKNTSKKTEGYYNYIEIGDINIGNGFATYNRIATEKLPANAKIEAKKGDILISKVRPNRGAVTIIDFDVENLIVSSAFTVLRKKEEGNFTNKTLKVLLRSKVYKEWLLKFNVGTQYPVIRDEDILNLPIPKITQIKQQEIANNIEQSQKVKEKTELLLDVAKQAVEIAIEQDEPTAINFINSKIN